MAHIDEDIIGGKSKDATLGAQIKGLRFDIGSMRIDVFRSGAFSYEHESVSIDC